MSKNNWDNYWNNFLYYSAFLKFHHFRIFTIYKKLLDQLNLKNPEQIEIGCGSATIALKILKRYRGNATLLDSSNEALSVAKQIFLKNNFSPTIIETNLFTFKPKKQFDLVHSEGLIEHFFGKQQQAVIKLHADCVSPKGFVLICVPRNAWYYRIARYILEHIRMWPFGYEKPLSKAELVSLMEKNGLRVIRALESGRFSYALAKAK